MKDNGLVQDIVGWICGFIGPFNIIFTHFGILGAGNLGYLHTSNKQTVCL